MSGVDGDFHPFAGLGQDLQAMDPVAAAAAKAMPTTRRAPWICARLMISARG